MFDRMLTYAHKGIYVPVRVDAMELMAIQKAY